MTRNDISKMTKDSFASDRAKKTLYVTGFDPRLTKKHVLEELFTQGGPVKEVIMFDTHAYILFQHEESVPYCLALFNEVELHGQKLRLNPRFRRNDTFCYMKYLTSVREKLMSEYMKIPPPDLPPKQSPIKKAKSIDVARKQTNDQAGKQAHKQTPNGKHKHRPKQKPQQKLRPTSKMAPKPKLERTSKQAPKTNPKPKQNLKQKLKPTPEPKHNPKRTFKQTSEPNKKKSKNGSNSNRKYKVSK